MTVQYVTFHPHVGSISHYYHFFFACLIPLLDYKLQHPHISEFRVFEKLGPFHRVVTGDVALNIRYIGNEVSTNSDHAVVVPLPSYDTFDKKYFSSSKYIQMPSSVRLNVIHYFESTLPKSARDTRRMWSNVREPRIVLIQRKSDPSYRVENTTSNFLSSSGADRRYIQNHMNIKSAMRLKYRRSFVNIALEKMNIYDQYVTFKQANILIAQHGAALSNMLFMQSLSDIKSIEQTIFANFAHVIEISPPYSREAQYFRNMAAHFNVSYSSIPQEMSKGDVDIELLMSHVECVIGNSSLAATYGVFAIGEACGDIVGTWKPPEEIPSFREQRRRRRRHSNATIRRRPRNYNKTLVRRRRPPVSRRKRGAPVRQPKPKSVIVPASESRMTVKREVFAPQ